MRKCDEPMPDWYKIAEHLNQALAQSGRMHRATVTKKQVERRFLLVINPDFKAMKGKFDKWTEEEVHSYTMVLIMRYCHNEYEKKSE
jgi:hypothetical protein